MTEPKSKLALALESRKPHQKTFDVQGIPNLDNGKVTFRILRHVDTSDALVMAYGCRDRDAKKHAAIADNKKHFDDLLTISTICLAARDSEKPDECPAFPSPDWMRQFLQNHELSILINLYNSFVAEVYPGGIEKLQSTEELLKFAHMVAANWKNDLPDLALAEFSHEVLAECFIRLCVVWEEQGRENEALSSMNLSLRAAGVVPKEEEVEGDGALSVYAVRLLAETAGSKQQDSVANTAARIATKQQAIVAMSMLGWLEGSPAWDRVIAEP